MPRTKLRPMLPVAIRPKREEIPQKKKKKLPTCWFCNKRLISKQEKESKKCVHCSLIGYGVRANVWGDLKNK